MFCGECARVSNKARYHNGSIKRNVIPGFQFRSAGLKKVTPLYLWQIVGQKQYKYGRIKPDNVDKWKIIGTYWAYENDF